MCGPKAGYRYWYRYPEWQYSQHGYMPRAISDYDDEKDLYTIKIALPGIEKEDIHVKAADDYIKVRANRKDEDSDKKKVYYKRKFYFRKRIDPQKISAKYENGLLRLEIHVKEESKAQDVAVN
ncbi:MAG: Hsp20/alpha crystallin family protein [Promethearchaeota archaeon]